MHSDSHAQQQVRLTQTPGLEDVGRVGDREAALSLPLRALCEPDYVIYTCVMIHHVLIGQPGQSTSQHSDKWTHCWQLLYNDNALISECVVYGAPV